LHGDRARDADPLLLPARELAGINVGLLRQPDSASAAWPRVSAAARSCLSTRRSAKVTFSSAVKCG